MAAIKSAGSKGNTQGTRRKTVFNCTECGSQAPKWAGQCGDCGAWNTLIEDVITTSSGGKTPPRYSGYAGESTVCNISDVTSIETSRIKTGFSELDRVLGDGLVNGSAVLIGGDPGIGKSTLLIQAIASLSQRVGTLYVTGEESLQQVSMRAHRLGLSTDKVRLLSETQVQRILALADKEKPGVLVIDSIQTVYTDQLNSAPGSVSQVRESAAHLVQYAKQTGTAIFLVGHVTKEGALAAYGRYRALF